MGLYKTTLLVFVEDGMSTVFGARKFRWQALAEAQDAYKKQLSAELCCSLVWIVLIVLERQGEKAGILSELDHQNFTAIWNVARKTLRAGVQELLAT